ncbi:non-canonical purine NTP pyrophosphatase, RdgB/HAM1 family [Halobacteriovorax marinus]|uniref:dITP/XTP pyrophosphatase n=1 Tax=Halobacteriovorax marinus TaxID=97084 RepID=A0A1Y5F2R3_9BACT|nr:non-canonical purine NTP pyrophosphatase, RdgB/HAM1 family [Halobacteriovorax marinus]
MKFILASGNPHKAEEFSELLDKDVIEVIAASEKLEVEENGKTYNENAFLKAKAYYDKFQVPVLADDSGLNVAALPEVLGIHSARYGGDGLNDQDRANLLLKNMEEQENRDAYFTCVLCFYISPQEIFFFEGRLSGLIGKEYKGEHGFGYDPVFHGLGPHVNESVAEVPEWKHENSHRAHACKSALKFFKERDCQIV